MARFQQIYYMDEPHPITDISVRSHYFFTQRRLPTARVWMFCACSAFSLFIASPQVAAAEPSPAISRDALRGLAKDFVTRMQEGRSRADLWLRQNNMDDDSGHSEDLGLLDGETLLFQVWLPDQIQLTNPIYAEVHDNHILLSLQDFLLAMDFPVTHDADENRYDGWFIRQNNPFTLDANEKIVTTPNGTSPLPDLVIIDERDVLVPVKLAGEWFGMRIDVDVRSLRLNVESSQNLPVQEKMMRDKRRAFQTTRNHPVLPRMDDRYSAYSKPAIDVNLRSSLRRGDSFKTQKDHYANIRTSGDLAYGTLSTNTLLDDRDYLSSFRMNYKRESLEPELLGPLGAHRYELGDLQPVQMPLTGSAPQEVGVRVTNAHPLRQFMMPTTQITGTTLPGWDVELYRENQLLSSQSSGDDGVYAFDNVALFAGSNSFRVVAYGPQGEVEEYPIEMPFDPSRAGTFQNVYDVSLTMSERSTYAANRPDSEDRDTVHLAATYDMPVGERSTMRFGTRVRQEEGEQKAYGEGTFSTIVGNAMISNSAAIDNDGEMANELTILRDFGPHQMRTAGRIASSDFDPGRNSGGVVRTRGAEISFLGPLGLPIGERPRYNLSAAYNKYNNGEDSVSATAGFNTTFKRVSFNQQFDLEKGSHGADLEARGQTAISGRIGRNNFRLRGQYDIEPETKLSYLDASWRYRFNNDLDSEIGIERRIDPALTIGRGQLNWRARYATFSPTISYDSKGDLQATLNTRFGLAPDPAGTYKIYNQGISHNGGASIFVFFDENGDGIFNEGEEPIESAIVSAPQNGGRQLTDKNGRAYFANMQPNRITDIELDTSSLKDPFWIPAYAGASVIPREGRVVEMVFPVVLSGEIDGTINASTAQGGTRPVRGMGLRLYTRGGQEVLHTKTGPDGFYLFSQVPPGDYLLILDEKDAKNMKLRRPLPQPITIGYDGTILYGNDLVLTEGQDIGIALNSDLSPYLSQNKLSADDAVPSVLLNLGSYSSRLLMSLHWYRIQKSQNTLLSGLKPLVMPSDSRPSLKDGRHILLLPLPAGATFDHAYKMCGALTARGVECGVEMPAQQKTGPSGKTGPLQLSSL